MRTRAEKQSPQVRDSHCALCLCPPLAFSPWTIRPVLQRQAQTSHSWWTLCCLASPPPASPWPKNCPLSAHSPNLPESTTHLSLLCSCPHHTRPSCGDRCCLLTPLAQQSFWDIETAQKVLANEHQGKKEGKSKGRGLRRTKRAKEHPQREMAGEI